ncbi:MAG: UDP-N-acetylmuramate dehydrogenase [Deltaproteobacteria bacterium]|nr:UDP-N-acetylmuramate dehydrogenase [Deltaproteobacteria bacterium]
MTPEENVALAPHTTLELGGRARYWVTAKSESELLSALDWAAARGLPLLLLGGGSNVVIADAGFDGIVIHVQTRGLDVVELDRDVLFTVAAGEPWDAVVAVASARGVWGVECLSGIPGLTGATPIQNVGAYGQEVSDTLEQVRVFDRARKAITILDNAGCAFAYRDSRFKREPDRFVVLHAVFRLARTRADTAAVYPELARRLSELGIEADTPQVYRDVVLQLRRGKSMVILPEDENRRSVGSFFMNPVVSVLQADAVVQRALAAGIVSHPSQVPQYPAGDGRRKLAAGWLIEKSGLGKGFRMGPVGISTCHALALVHHGGGTTAELLALGRRVRDEVAAVFGVTLAPEPNLVGVSL